MRLDGPIERLLAVAGALVGITDTDTGRHADGVVSLFLRAMPDPRPTRPGDGWNAAFVHHVGYWSQFDHATRRSSWPLPATSDLAQLADFGRRHGIVRPAPEVGDVYLLWSERKRAFQRAGIVAAIDAGSSESLAVCTCTTIEGEVSSVGAPGGSLVRRLDRRFSPGSGDLMLRWSVFGRTHVRAAVPAEPADPADRASPIPLRRAA